MRIGVPKEIKPQENRIGLTPESVKILVSEGHQVLVENNGGFEAGFENDQYTKAGAPFYWYSEYLDYSYSSNAGKRSITFYKYFYKNKREYKFIEYLEHSFFDEYSPGYHKSLWDDSMENFPVIFLVIHSRNKELDGSIIKMEYENNMVSKNIEDIINKKTIEILNKMF